MRGAADQVKSLGAALGACVRGSLIALLHPWRPATSPGCARGCMPAIAVGARVSWSTARRVPGWRSRYPKWQMAAESEPHGFPKYPAAVVDAIATSGAR